MFKRLTNYPVLISNVSVLIISHYKYSTSNICFKYKYMTYVLNFLDIIGVKFNANGTDTKLKAIRRVIKCRCT